MRLPPEIVQGAMQLHIRSSLQILFLRHTDILPVCMVNNDIILIRQITICMILAAFAHQAAGFRNTVQPKGKNNHLRNIVEAGIAAY